MTLTEIRGKHVIATVESDKGLKPMDISNFLDAYDRVVEEVYTRREFLRKLSAKWGYDITFLEDCI